MMEIPPVIVTAINLKTIINEKHGANEIVSASVICCHKAKVQSLLLSDVHIFSTVFFIIYNEFQCVSIQFHISFFTNVDFRKF